MQGQFEGLDPPAYYVLAERGLEPPNPRLLRDLALDTHPGIVSESENSEAERYCPGDLREALLGSAETYMIELLTSVELPAYIENDQDLHLNSVEARDRFCQALADMRYIQAKRGLLAALEHRIDSKRRVAAMLREQRRRILESDGELVATFQDTDLPFHFADVM